MKFIYTLILPLVLTGWSTVLFGQQTVTSTSDSGPGSLREALQQASAGEEINISSAVSNQTIVLSTPLIVTQPVTINGGNGNGRRARLRAQLVFQNAGSVTLSNMTFAGNSAFLVELLVL